MKWTDRASRSVGVLSLLVTSVGWGINWPIMKFLLSEWPPLFARGVSGLTAALILAVVAIATGERLAVPRRLIPRLVLSAFFNVFAWMGFSTLALRWLTAGQGAMLVYTMPVWAALLVWPVLGKRPAMRSVAGLILCMSGIGVLFGAHSMPLGAAQLPGVSFALAAAALFAFSTVALGPLPLPPFGQLAWQLAIGCAPMAAFGVLVEKPDWQALDTRGMAAMTYMTVFPMGICYLTWFAATRRLPPAIASMGTLLTPAVGVVSAAVVLDEPLGLQQWLALLLVIGGVALALRRP